EFSWSSLRCPYCGRIVADLTAHLKQEIDGHDPIYDPDYEATFDTTTGTLTWRCRECGASEQLELGADFSRDFSTQRLAAGRFPHLEDCPRKLVVIDFNDVRD